MQSSECCYSVVLCVQAIAELEQRWCCEVEDIRQGALTPSQAFFIDYHLVEVRQTTTINY